MIRAVKVIGVYPGEDDADARPQLAFYDTVCDKFITFTGMVLFDSRKEWEDWAAFGSVNGRPDPDTIDRCRRLMPSWLPDVGPYDD